MKALLVNPPANKIVEPLHDTPRYIHLGLAHIYSTLKTFTDYNVIFKDCKFERISYDGLFFYIIKNKPDFIGFTSKTLDIENVLSFCEKIKKKYSPFILIGGPHTAAKSYEVIKNENIDFCVFGEFETGIISLLKRIKEKKYDFSGIKNLVWKKGKDVIYNEAGFSEEKHIVPVRWHELKKADHYYVMATRGCPQRCVFCMRVLGEKVRYRKIENVVKELDNIRKKNKNAVVEFADETFTLNFKYVFSLLKKIIDEKFYENFKFYASTRIDRIDGKILKVMKKAGFSKIILGVESGDDRVLKLAKKDINVKLIVKKCKLVKKIGISLEANFIVGLPGENIFSLLKTAVLASRIKPDILSVSIAMPYPGTKLYEYALKGKFGYKLIAQTYRDFNNEFGKALEFRNINIKILEFFQAFIYVFSFLGSLRIKEFIVFFKTYRKEALNLLKKFLERE